MQRLKIPFHYLVSCLLIFVLYILKLIFAHGSALASYEIPAEGFNFFVFLPLICLYPGIKSYLSDLRESINIFSQVSLMLILVLLADFSLRATFTVPVILSGDFLATYTRLKFGGLFTTTNVTGWVCFLVSCISLFRTKDWRTLCLSTTLLIFCFARAAYLSHLLLFLLYALNKFLRINFSWLKIIILLLFGAASFALSVKIIPVILESIFSDGSVLSKFYFMKIFYQKISTDGLYEFFLGSNFTYYDVQKYFAFTGIKLSPHLPFIKAYVYGGVILLAICLLQYIELFLSFPRGWILLISISPLIFTGVPILWVGSLYLSLLCIPLSPLLASENVE